MTTRPATTPLRPHQTTPTRLPGLAEDRTDRPAVLVARTDAELEATTATFVPAGRRADRAFEPTGVRAGIVTCGGLCPGLNDVIRSVTLTLRHDHGVEEVLGYRYGFAGLATGRAAPIALTHDAVDAIHRHGGTLLGSSRGPQDVAEMVDTLAADGVSILICIGGDGTLRGASAIAREALGRDLRLAVVGVPKTIDNDIDWIERSFGFITAVQRATEAIEVAHDEARGVDRGVGIVRLMGRHSGFIAAQATIADPDVNVCLVPEIPLELEGPTGLVAHLDRRLDARGHAVIAVAEGAGQQLVPTEGRDASGNARLGDIGAHLRDELARRLTGASIRYIDPSYLIRGCRANAEDSAFCTALGQDAAHAAIAGFTDVVIGHWSGHATILPIELATGRRRQLDPHGDVWARVVATTRQPTFG